MKLWKSSFRSRCQYLISKRKKKHYIVNFFFLLVFLKQHSLSRLEYDYEGSNYYVWNKKHKANFYGKFRHYLILRLQTSKTILCGLWVRLTCTGSILTEVRDQKQTYKEREHNSGTVMTERNHVILNQKEIYMGRYIFFFFFHTTDGKKPSLEIRNIIFNDKYSSTKTKKQKNKKTTKCDSFQIYISQPICKQ